MTDTEDLSPPDSAIIRQREVAERIKARWRSRVGAIDPRSVLDAHTELDWDHSIMLSIVYEAYCLRSRIGDSIDDASFVRQFPELGTSLVRLLDVHHFIFDQSETLPSNPSVDWPQVGDTVADLLLVAEVGRGAFARAFLAHEGSLRDRSVVVKVAQHVADEAGTLAQLAHPNIVPVHSVKTDELTGLTAICMPFLGIATIQHVVDALSAEAGNRGYARSMLRVVQQINGSENVVNVPFNPERVYRWGTLGEAVMWIGWRLSEALACAHACGVCHGDVKPSNVLIDPNGNPLLIDFNLARTNDDSQRLGGHAAVHAS